jgi:hypothetical protein
MSFKQTRNKIMEYLINGNNKSMVTSPNNVILEAYINQGNNVEYNYLPFINIEKNRDVIIKKYNQTVTNLTGENNNDKLIQIYVLGLSCLGLFILNSVLNKNN